MSVDLLEQPAIETTPMWSRDEDGFCVNNLTGEVISSEEFDFLGLAAPIVAPAATRIETRDDAERALSHLAYLEAELIAVKARHKASNENYQTQETQLVQRIKSWEWKHKTALIEFARPLKRGRIKSVTFDNGQVAFKDCQEDWEVLNPDDAATWVALYAPELVKIERSVEVKDLDATIKETEADINTLKFIKVIPAHEETKIKTNVKKGRDE